ncbi:MAG: hypothetical protein AB7K08_13625 [Microbacteriaceae bacterium]
MRGHRSALLVPVVLVALLTGCGGDVPAETPAPSASASAPSPSPTPTPAPTAPAAADLVLTTTGLGTLAFGEAPSVDPLMQMVAEDPNACVEYSGAAPGTPESTRWRPVPAYDGLFGVAVVDGVLTRVDIFSAAIPTDEGIHLGSPAADVVAAYPTASVTNLDLTDVVVVADAHGTLMIEIARERGLFDGPYWAPDQVDRVIYLRGTSAGEAPYTVAASENVAGGCS